MFGASKETYQSIVKEEWNGTRAPFRQIIPKTFAILVFSIHNQTGIN